MSAPSVSTLKALFGVSGNMCAFPRCRLPNVDRKTGLTVAEVCHIRGRAKGGPRYERAQTDRERHGVDNLILLCPNHHKMVDARPKKYTAEVLGRMRQRHERAMARRRPPLPGPAAIRKLRAGLLKTLAGGVVAAASASGRARVHQHVISVAGSRSVSITIGGDAKAKDPRSPSRPRPGGPGRARKSQARSDRARDLSGSGLYSGHTITLPKIRWPPVLRDLQKNILDAVAEHWRLHGTWPPRKRVLAAFDKQGLPIDDALARFQRGILSTEREGYSPDEMIVLQLPGVALTPGGDAVARLFLSLLQTGINLYVADPFGRVTVTDADLLLMAPDLQPTDHARFGLVIAKELGASRSPNGWSWEPRLSHVRFDGVTDIWEYIRRRDAHFRDAKLDIDADDLLRHVYDTWHTSGEWPQLARFVIEHRAHGSIRDWLIEHQQDLWDFDSMGEVDELLKLRVEAVERVAPDAPELDLFVRIVRHARKCYLEDQDARLTDTELAAALTVAPQEVRRVAELLHTDYDSGLMVLANDGWSLKCDEGLRQWDGLVDIADYLKRRDKRRKKTAWRGV